jgi:hypothetical protein
MGVSVEVQEQLVAKFQAILPHLDERQHRLLMGAEARVLGHGGIRAVAKAVGVREATVALGVDELDAGPVLWDGPVSPAGAGKRPPTSISGCVPRCWPWSSRTNAVMRCHRCGGPRNRGRVRRPMSRTLDRR